MNITKEEAIRLLGRYDTEYYTTQTREAHRMGIAALNRVEELEKELADERHRHDRYVDFELAEAAELQAAMEQLNEHGSCDVCEYEDLPDREYPCCDCLHLCLGSRDHWKWKKPETVKEGQ